MLTQNEFVSHSHGVTLLQAARPAVGSRLQSDDAAPLALLRKVLRREFSVSNTVIVIKAIDDRASNGIDSACFINTGRPTSCMHNWLCMYIHVQGEIGDEG